MADEAGRRSFRRTAPAGIVLAALGAVASAKPWLGGSGAGTDASTSSLEGLGAGLRYPLASAVSLVLLAAWGVLLVTRDGVRRGFALVAALASLGLVAAVIAGYLTLPDQAGGSFEELMGRGGDTGFTGWFWTAAVCAVLAVPPALAAVRRAGSWPEMGSRYDAPGSRTPAAEAAVETDRDLWEQLDEGRDPTADR